MGIILVPQCKIHQYTPEYNQTGIFYTTDDPPSPMVTCAHYLDQNNLFTIVIEILISPYIVAENVLERILIIPRLVEYANGSIVDQDAFPLISVQVDLILQLYFTKYPSPETN